MNTLIVIDQKQEWPFELPGVAVVTARRYLAEPDSRPEGSLRVLNLCRTSRYQGRGYYVSLVAEARSQQPLPSVRTVEELKSNAYVQALQGPINRGQNVFARKPLVSRVIAHLPVDLGGNDDILAPDTEMPEQIAGNLLTFAQ